MVPGSIQHPPSQEHSSSGDRPHTYYTFGLLSDRITEREVSGGPAQMHVDGAKSPYHAEPAETVRHNPFQPHPTQKDRHSKAFIRRSLHLTQRIARGALL